MTRRHSDPEDKYFDDFTLGEVMITRGRTIDAADLSVFAGLTGDHYPLHTDEEYAKSSRFETRIAHGPFTFSVAVGLVALSNFYGNSIVALVEISSLRALKPVVPGDTVHVQAEVVGLKPGNKPKYGEITVNYSVRNQRDEEVMSFLQVMLARRRVGGESS
jgi:acyl dehydratase